MDDYGNTIVEKSYVGAFYRVENVTLQDNTTVTEKHIDRGHISHHSMIEKRDEKSACQGGKMCKCAPL